MADIRNLGNFKSIADVWAAHPNGGIEGDYLYIGVTKYNWNKYAQTWGDEDDPSSPDRQHFDVSDMNVLNELNVGGNSNVHGDLNVDGMLRAGGVKQPCLGLFASAEALGIAYPNPEVGMWAVVGDSLPGNVYRCNTAGEWAATGGTSGLDALSGMVLYSGSQTLTNAQKKQARANIGLGNGDIDDVPTGSSQNVVKSGGVESAIRNNPQLGYYVCDTGAGTATKSVTASGYALPTTGGSIKIKMTNANTAANATLRINSLDAKALYYNGQRASSDNSWEAGEVVEVYYDPTGNSNNGAFFANNVAGGGSDGVFDLTAKTGDSYGTLAAALTAANSAISATKKKGGMSIKYVDSDGKYVQYRLMATSFSTAESDWQGVDEEPTQGSDNLVKSGGAYKQTHLSNVPELNDFVVDIVFKAGENIDWSSVTGITIQCCKENSGIWQTGIWLYVNGVIDNRSLLYKSYENEADAIADLGSLMEGTRCYVVLRYIDLGVTHSRTIPKNLVFNRSVTWGSLNEHPIIKALLIEGKNIPEHYYNKTEVDGKVADINGSIDGIGGRLDAVEDAVDDVDAAVDEIAGQIGDDFAAKVGEYVENNEYLRVITDKNDKFLFGIRKDGSIEWGVGVPRPVKEYFEEQMAHYNAVTDEEKEILELSELTENDEYLRVVKDKNDGILLAIKKNGDIVFGTGVPSEIKQFVEDYVESYASEKKEQKPFIATDYDTELNHALNATVQVPTKPAAVGNAHIITISNQTEFDALPTTLTSAIVDYTNIIVLIKAGKYVYSPVAGNAFISLSGLSESTTSISIVGEEGTVLIPRYDAYDVSSNGASIDGTMVSVPLGTGKTFDYENVMLDGYDNLIDYINDNKFRFMDELVSLVVYDEQEETYEADTATHEDGETVIGAIANTGYPDMSAAASANLYVQITSQWETGIFPVVEINDGNIYFEWEYKKYSSTNNLFINADYHFSGSKVMPRYRLINYPNDGHVYVDGDNVLHFPLSLKEVKILNKTRFFSAANSALNSISVSGITFNGVSGQGYSCLGLESVTAGYVRISNCTFKHTYDFCVLIHKSPNVEVCNNIFSDNYNAGMYLYVTKQEGGASDKAYIHDNMFFNTGMLSKGYAIKVGGYTNVLIKDNFIENYSYDGICTAGNEDVNENYTFSGIIEGNVIVCTPEYYNDRMQHSLMDSGGIYIHNYGGDTVVRWNVIVRHSGMWGDNGIFCDDGSTNFSLLGNVILDCNNNNSIKSWYRSGLYPEHNTNNSMFYNIVNAPIRFEGYKDDENGCKKGPQILLGNIVGHIYNDIPDMEDDFVIVNYEVRDDTIYAIPEVVNALRGVLDGDVRYRLEYLHNK